MSDIHTGTDPTIDPGAASANTAATGDAATAAAVADRYDRLAADFAPPALVPADGGFAPAVRD